MITYDNEIEKFGKWEKINYIYDVNLPTNTVEFVSLLEKNRNKIINLKTYCSNSFVKSDTLSLNICDFCSAGVGFAVIFGNFLSVFVSLQEHKKWLDWM